MMLLGWSTASGGVPELPGDSIYKIESVWTASHGRKTSLSAFAGKPALVAMFYTHCTSVCPAIVQTLKRVEPKVGTRAQFVLVTLDSERDNMKVLSEFAALHGLTGSQWTLLTGSADQVRELSVALQLKQSPAANGEFIHTNAITVLDSSGRIVGSNPGGADPEQLLQILAPLLVRSP